MDRLPVMTSSLPFPESGSENPFFTETRPWGSFTVLQDMPHYKLKLLQVTPGSRLSLQMHYHRAEHWFVVSGAAQVTVNDTTWLAPTGTAIDIPKEARHRVANPGPDLLEIIEVQHGESFEESDIVRFEDDYKRILLSFGFITGGGFGK